ncbi:MAG: hypothetical protein BWY52_03261 [Chloroflexi bacterium ADurb.Bin325]|nr:MAG: hypothetical protein BWY52_03261 [Chloroflexi bacterium ADurb.Bin325]
MHADGVPQDAGRGRPVGACLRSMLAQRGHQRQRRGPARLAMQGLRVQRAARPAVADTGVDEIGVAAAEVEVGLGLAPAAAHRVGRQVGRGPIPPVGQGDGVGDGVDIAHLPRGPMTARRLQHPRVPRVGDEIAVVVIELMGEAVVAALPVLPQERDDHLQRLHRGRAPLQPQAQQIHPQQPADPGVRLLGEHRLVADSHAVFVDPHLRAPDPERLGQRDRIGVGRLCDLDVGAAEAAVRRMIRSRDQDDMVGLVGLAVRVLSEERHAIGRGSRGNDQGIAHRGSPWSKSVRTLTVSHFDETCNG